jgi:hypothetical protein
MKQFFRVQRVEQLGPAHIWIIVVDEHTAVDHDAIFARNAFADLKPQVRNCIASRRTQTESLTASPCTTMQIKKAEGCVMYARWFSLQSNESMVPTSHPGTLPSFEALYE